MVNFAGSDWVRGDHYGVPIPADPAGLRAGGTDFLTAAFRAYETLGADNAVTGITECREVPGGSTGRKVALRVEYQQTGPGQHTDLFVKFSRDLHNPIRDRAKTQMESEVLFAALSRLPGFPVAVPTTLFGDYHRDTGTGLLISQRIRFGCNGIERQYHKCLDDEMPEPLEHYRALLTALARLVGAHRSGRLPTDLTGRFPIDLRAAGVAPRTAISADKLRRRLTEVADFADTHPGLLPANVRSPQFVSRLRDEAPRLVRHETAVWRYLGGRPDYLALCHWNANVDNAWFWRDTGGTLQCGLMDWGCTSQMNVAMAIWGALSGAETDLWNHDLDGLLQLFVDEVEKCGGPALDPRELRDQIALYAAVMGVAWLLDVPALIHTRFGGSTPPVSRKDPRIRQDESVRAPLQMFTNFLNLWQTQRVGSLLDPLLARGW